MVELKPQQHLNLLPAITLAHFSNNSGFKLRCENPYSSGGGLKVVSYIMTNFFFYNIHMLGLRVKSNPTFQVYDTVPSGG